MKKFNKFVDLIDKFFFAYLALFFSSNYYEIIKETRVDSVMNKFIGPFPKCHNIIDGIMLITVP